MRFSALMLSLTIATSPVAASAQSAVQRVDLGGNSVAVVPNTLTELQGIYKYERKGEPIIDLRADGTGLFQPHQVPAIPIKYWLLADDAGKPAKIEGAPGTYRYTIVLQYGPGGGGNYPEGKYDSMYWTKLADDPCPNILGERFKC